jgi:hypothetical protein
MPLKAIAKQRGLLAVVICNIMLSAAKQDPETKDFNVRSSPFTDVLLWLDTNENMHGGIPFGLTYCLNDTCSFLSKKHTELPNSVFRG